MDHDALRRAITAIHADPTLAPREADRRVQALMTANMHVPPPSDTTVADVTTEADRRATFQDEEKTVHGCKHYQQRCRLLMPCCQRWFTCRLCHDAESDHEVDRYAIATMCCMLCGAVQAVGTTCAFCHESMARYYCDICHLFEDSRARRIYHCPDCRICRVGEGLGKDFFHCPRCDICMAITLRDKHRCVDQTLRANCPVCLQYMFTSTKVVVFMPCGHGMHSVCYNEYVRHNYVCPTCLKSVQDMSAYNEQQTALLASQPMPAEYANWRADVLCNDCVKRSWVPYHFLGHQCASCQGYNTAVMHLDKRPPSYVPATAVDVDAAAAAAATASPAVTTPGASLLSNIPWLQTMISQFRDARRADANDGDDDEADAASGEQQDENGPDSDDGDVPAQSASNPAAD